MRHIHPFPARMAPEIAMTKIEKLVEGQTVLDPMSGSGMVLGQCAKNGLQSIGYDLDPLARMISQVGATRTNTTKAEEALEQLIELCKSTKNTKKKVDLDWIDNDPETTSFIEFWFHENQIKQLRLLAYHLTVCPFIKSPKILNVLRVALSRLIITKEPKASLARDTAHSRPHRTITENDFDIFSALPHSLQHVISALDSSEISYDTKTYVGDARRMTRIANNSVDAIITSPPYLNAIDYMRGHRLSLVWFGYSMSTLRAIRAKSIGTERIITKETDHVFEKLIRDWQLNQLEDKKLKMLERYFLDLCAQTQETYRTLKPRATATYVIGNSTIQGCYIRNNELLKKAGRLAGFRILGEVTREIPNNLRYLPIPADNKNSLATRMRTEHVIDFVKR